MTSERDRLAAALPAYEIGEELGRGAFGVVWGGENRYLGRRVAIKQLAAPDATVRARILAEAKVLASLEHPHVVPLYEYVEDGELCLLVMERLDGGTLGQRFSLPRPIDVADACAVAMVTCSGLHHAHQRRVLHRDVKPDNLIFSADGTLKVADFGIAKVVTDGARTFSTVTVKGTPAYMAPEQLEGQHLGPGVDIYATGMLLYELLSGQTAYPTHGEALMVALRHLNDDPYPLGDVAPQLGGELADITMQALNRLPADRFATAEDFGVAIGRAATTVLGPGWLDQSQVKLLAAGPILDSAHVAPWAAKDGHGAGPTVIVPGAGGSAGAAPRGRAGRRVTSSAKPAAPTTPAKTPPATAAPTPPAPPAPPPAKVAKAKAAQPAKAASPAAKAAPPAAKAAPPAAKTAPPPARAAQAKPAPPVKAASPPAKGAPPAKAAAPPPGGPPPLGNAACQAPHSLRLPPVPPLPPAGSGPTPRSGQPPAMPPAPSVPPTAARRGRRLLGVFLVVVALLVVIVKVASNTGGGPKSPGTTTTTCFTNDGSHAPPLGSVTYC